MILYLDTSSLVKLYVEESGSTEVRAHVRKASVVATSVIAYAEARSAFARRGREGSFSKADLGRIKVAFEADWSGLLTLNVTHEIATEAGDLAERHALRGFDSLHLACYLSLCAQFEKEDVEFSSFDESLNRAAAVEHG